MLFSIDEMLLAAVDLGVRWGVEQHVQLAAPLLVRMLAAADAGDWPAARLLPAAKTVDLVRVIEEFSGCPANKAQ